MKITYTVYLNIKIQTLTVIQLLFSTLARVQEFILRSFNYILDITDILFYDEHFLFHLSKTHMTSINLRPRRNAMWLIPLLHIIEYHGTIL